MLLAIGVVAELKVQGWCGRNRRENNNPVSSCRASSLTETIIESRKCRNTHCNAQFGITDRDQAFYHKLKVPKPICCPACREELRTLHINQLQLFKRKCNATGKDVISNYPSDSPFQVYEQEYWYSDAFDGTVHGREFDFSRSFFEQYNELALEVPRPALFTDYLRDENSAYTNYAGLNKNCYLIFDSDENWDCYYSYGINSCRNSLDCYRGEGLELCCQTVDSRNCYNCAFLYNCDTCYDSICLQNCIGCRNCIMCSNLRHKEYHIFNKQVSKEEFKEMRRALGSYSVLSERQEEFQNFRLQFPQRFMRGFQNENVTGDHLVNCKNAFHCFDCRGLWDGKYCYQVFMKAKDCMDCHEVGNSELLYECNNLGYNGYNLRFCLNCLNQVTNLTYCNYCFNGCSDLFGCIGLKRKKFCILNYEYAPDEYQILVERIIKHLEETGEWGQFFPASTSSFPYNLSIAQESFPLTKDEALERNYLWRDNEQEKSRSVTMDLPDTIDEVSEDITKELLSCVNCGKNYKVITQEFKFYKGSQLPLPRKCFDCRHLERVAIRSPRYLWKRNCNQCNLEFQTSFAPNRPEVVYCENCYLESMT